VLIVVADAVMSLDNVVAVAAAAQDSVRYLIFGLLLSVPILVFSSLFVTRILDAYPLLVQAGAALLGWIAGKTAVVRSGDRLGGHGDAVLRAGRAGTGARRRLRAIAGAHPARAAQPGQVAAAMPVAPMRARPGAPAALPSCRSTRRFGRKPAPARAHKRIALALDARRQARLRRRAPTADPAAPPRPTLAAGRQRPATAERRRSAQHRSRKLTNMDLTIMAGVAVPALGLVATLIYIIAKAIGSR
jgi:hypothetical protein